MKKISPFFSLLLLSLLLGLNFFQVHAQKISLVPTVKIFGISGKELNLNLDSIHTIPIISLTRKDKEGKDHIYRGVPLYKILLKAGAPLGKELRGKNLKLYVLINARDGYQVVFSLAELDPEFTDNSTILANEMDGRTLPDTEGPFRIIVEKDKKMARSVRQVTEIKILSTQ